MTKLLSLLLALSPLAAFAAGDCREEARAKTQDQVDAYSSLAKQYPQDFGKWACYEGQKITFAYQKLVYSAPNGDVIGYRFTVPCGDQVDTYGFDYRIGLNGRCELSGE